MDRILYNQSTARNVNYVKSIKLINSIFPNTLNKYKIISFFGKPFINIILHILTL